MVDDPGENLSEEKAISPQPVSLEDRHPTGTFPTVFADGVKSLAHGPNVVKFYLCRFDPSTVGDGTIKVNSFAQVIMPLAGFAETAVFFQTQLDIMIAKGLITQDQVQLLKDQQKAADVTKRRS